MKNETWQPKKQLSFRGKFNKNFKQTRFILQAVTVCTLTVQRYKQGCWGGPVVGAAASISYVTWFSSCFHLLFFFRATIIWSETFWLDYTNYHSYTGSSTNSPALRYLNWQKIQPLQQLQPVFITMQEHQASYFVEPDPHS